MKKVKNSCRELATRIRNEKINAFSHIGDGYNRGLERAADIVLNRQEVPFAEAITGLISGRFKQGRGLNFSTHLFVELNEKGTLLVWEYGGKYSPGPKCLGYWEVFS